MSTTTIKIICVTIGVTLLAGCSTGPKVPGKYAETAKCLTEKGVIMYGAFWCPHCQNQKHTFGDDFQFVTYQECDDKGPNGDKQVCLKAGVKSYPTWIFPGQGNLVGEQPIFVLAKLANCQDTLPEEDKDLLKKSKLTTEVKDSTTAEPVVKEDTSATNESNSQ